MACETMSDMIDNLLIDEDKHHALMSYRKTKHGSRVVASDHNSLITKVTSEWNKKLPAGRIEMYNLKDQEGLKKFKEMTSKDDFLSSVFTNGN